jgi:hypothetical protein
MRWRKRQIWRGHIDKQWRAWKHHFWTAVTVCINISATLHTITGYKLIRAKLPYYFCNLRGDNICTLVRANAMPHNTAAPSKPHKDSPQNMVDVSLKRLSGNIMYMGEFIQHMIDYQWSHRLILTGFLNDRGLSFPDVAKDCWITHWVLHVLKFPLNFPIHLHV